MATYTQNYNLDKYEGSDKPNLRDQYNSAMEKIDNALKTIDDKASQPATAYTGVTPVQVTGTQISVMNAGVGTSGVVTLTSDVNTASSSTVPTTAAVKSYVDNHSGGGGASGITNIVGTNGVTAQVSGSSATVSGQYASTVSPGVVNLAVNVDSASTSAVPTASAVKQYVDAHSGGGGTGGVTNVNASNGLTGSVSGSTLNISGVNASATQPGVVQKVTNMTGGGTDSVPTCGAVIAYVADQIDSGGSSANINVTGLAPINVESQSLGDGSKTFTVSADTASTSSAGVVRLASSGSSSTQAATASYVNSVAESLTNVRQQIHQHVTASGSNVTNAEGDIFILPQLGIGIAMLYLQTSSDLATGAQVKYNYTVPAAYRPPQQAQVLRLYNHLTGSGLLGQVRSDGEVYISVEGGTGVNFVGCVTVVWGFEVA